jgi:membrane fusion protein (multidrug efflux system)
MKRAFPVLVTLLLAAGCGPRDGGPAEEAAPRAVPVEVTEVALGSVVSTVTATGTVAARHDVPVSAEASGRVSEVPVGVGDRVAAGQALVHLDSELAELALQQAKAQLLVAEADHETAEANLERARVLWENGDISDSDFEAADRAAKAARGALLAADAGRSSAARQLRNTAIESPVDGTVAFVYAKVGHLVAAGTPVAHVVDDSSVEIDIGLSEDQVAHVRSGQRAEVSIRALPGEVFRGRVEYVGRRADDRTRTYPARIVVANPRGRLRSGVVAEVVVAAREYEDSVVIERDWIVERFGEPAVFVAADSLAVIRKVELGQIIGDRVVVLDGLEPGDLLISFGFQRLTEGARIDVRAPGEPEDAGSAGSVGEGEDAAPAEPSEEPETAATAEPASGPTAEPPNVPSEE